MSIQLENECSCKWYCLIATATQRRIESIIRCPLWHTRETALPDATQGRLVLHVLPVGMRCQAGTADVCTAKYKELVLAVVHCLHIRRPFIIRCICTRRV